ncbi:Uncharacterized protein QTN25_007671 [Entamoeba marina]
MQTIITQHLNYLTRFVADNDTSQIKVFISSEPTGCKVSLVTEKNISFSYYLQFSSPTVMPIIFPVHQQYMSLCQMVRPIVESHTNERYKYFSQFFQIHSTLNSTKGKTTITLFLTKTITQLQLVLVNNAIPMIDRNEMEKISKALCSVQSYPLVHVNGSVTSYCDLPNVGGMLIETNDSEEEEIIEVANEAFMKLRGGKDSSNTLVDKIQEALIGIVEGSDNVQFTEDCKTLIGNNYQEKLKGMIAGAVYDGMKINRTTKKNKI